MKNPSLALAVHRSPSRRALLRHAEPRMEPLEPRLPLATFRVIDGSGPACNATGRYCEVQKAIHAAHAGDTILVSPGTYDPFVVDRNQLTITGIVRRGERPVITTPMWSPVVRITGSGNRLSQFDVRGVSGVVVEGDRNQVRDNRLSAPLLAPSARGLDLRGTGNEATGNEASGFDAGFAASGTSNRLASNLASNARVGFLVAGSAHTLLANTAVGNDVGFLASGSSHQLSENSALHNRSDGFRLVGGQLTRVLDNFAAENGGTGIRTQPDPCISVCPPATMAGQTLVNNRVEANLGDGIAVADAHNTVDFNVVNGNGGAGIAIGGDFASLFANHVEANGDAGIHITGDSGTFTENVVSSNAGPGFLLLASTGASLASNTSSGHTTNFLLQASTGCRLLQNQATLGDVGFMLHESSDNRLSGNVAHGHLQQGMKMESSHRNQVTGNSLTANAREGLVLVASTHNWLEANELTDNGGEAGLAVSNGSHDNGLRGNLIARNAGHGLLVHDSLRGAIEENDVLENVASGLAVLAADYHTIVRNRLHRNNAYGIYVDAILSNYFAENEYDDNGLGEANLPGVC